MSDRQLTVAELLARAGKTGESQETPRRRRRRSLEEGGISVAELTGSIPRVKEKPADSRHSDSPIDGPEEPQEAPTPERAQRPEAAQDAETTPTLPQESAQGADATPALQHETPEQPGETELATEPEKDVERTAETQRVSEELPQPQQHTPQAEPAPREDEAEGTPAEERTGVLPVVKEDAADAATQPEKAPEAAPEDEGPAAGQAQEKSREELEDEPQYAFFDDDGNELPHTPAENEEEHEGEGSWLGTIALAVAGIVLGIVVFLGFQRLWESHLNSIIVAVLGLGVTAVMMAVVHVLRTSRDGLSMLLAAVVGLLMTFGPMIITLA